MPETHLLHLTITRVDGPLFEGNVISVSVPGVDGDMTILSRHEALISPLRAGVVLVRKEDGDQVTFPVESGTLEISDNEAIVLI